MKGKELVSLLKETCIQWWGDNTSQLGAALAYYTVFALAPLAVMAVAIAGLVFGEQAARGEMARQIEEAVGPTIAKAIEEVVRQAHNGASSLWATIVGVVVLLVGAASMFAQLQTSLNTIWGVTPKPGRGVRGVIKDRLLSFLAVLVVGALLLLSLAIQATLAALARYVGPAEIPGGVHVWQFVDLIVSFGLLTLLFALLYKVLPDVQLHWSDVWVGAAVTAVLFSIGNYLIGLYLGYSSAASAYGAAGSLVVILLWVFYSSQVLLFGAEFTQVYADRRGKALAPTGNAVAVSPEAQVRQAAATSQTLRGAGRV
jgi:membrane protein